MVPPGGTIRDLTVHPTPYTQGGYLEQGYLDANFE